MKKDRKNLIIGIVAGGIISLVIATYFSNSPTQNIGNINMGNSTNTVATINQSGGITAGQVVINNPTINNTPRRQINDHVIALLNKSLPQNQTNTIHLFYPVNDQEAYQFRNQIGNYLKNQGWKITFDGELYAHPFTGIHFEPQSNGDLSIEVGSNP